MKVTPILATLSELLGPNVVLLRCKPGSKKPLGKWGALTIEDMTPEYLRKCERGNIGVALGRVSSDLVVVDCDKDELVPDYLASNPDWKGTLRTRGARGCGFWLWMDGDYPGGTLKLRTHSGDDAGEFRSNGSQSIIHGIHPNGHAYQMLHKATPIITRFDQIVWPTQIAKPPSNVTQLHSCTATQLHSFTATHAVSVEARSFTVEQIVELAIPTANHTSHNLLWLLARGVKSLEKASGKATPEQLSDIFNRWYLLAKPKLRPDQCRDQYMIEFMQAYANARLPLGETGITEAWKRAQQKPFPPEAVAVFTDDKFRLIVSFLRELQINAGNKPFYLSCRTLAKLLEKETHMTCSRYLTALRVMGFIEEVSKGTIGPNGTASCYRYKGAIE